MTTSPVSAAAGASDALDLVRRHMSDAVASATGGRLAAMIDAHLASGGKRTRARLALEAAAALGVEPRRAVGWAAACELLHNATLIHDDIQDGDAVRRGQPALWARHGVAQAINAGDAMLLLPVTALELDATLPDALRWRLVACLGRRALRTATGQALELELGPRGEVAGESHWPLYCEAALGKSGQLLALPFEGAALLGDASPTAARELGDAVETLGLLYQLRDDVADLYSVHSGRARGGDLRAGRLGALLAVHLDARARHPDAPRTPPLLADDDGAAVDRVARTLADDGTLDEVVARGHALAAALLAEPLLTARPALLAIVERLALRLRDDLDTLRRDAADAHPHDPTR